MKISRSEFARFKATPHHGALRYGQAWFNYFNLHKHTAANPDEQRLLDRIWNERDSEIAERLILDNFTDEAN